MHDDHEAGKIIGHDERGDLPDAPGIFGGASSIGSNSFVANYSDYDMYEPSLVSPGGIPKGINNNDSYVSTNSNFEQLKSNGSVGSAFAKRRFGTRSGNSRNNSVSDFGGG